MTRVVHPALLEAGPLTAVLDGDALREIRVDGFEAIQAIYVSVRGTDWSTVRSRVVQSQIHQRRTGFHVELDVEHRGGEIMFRWQGTIEGWSDGSVCFGFQGEAVKAFKHNRISFCVLHPMELAGVDLEVVTGRGPVADVFPTEIASTNLFHGMKSLRHRVGPTRELELEFYGGHFEMEDQRNWTDASFKTTSTPSEFPVAMMAQERVHQEIGIMVYGSKTPPRLVPAPVSSRVEVTVGGPEDRRLPPIGIGQPLQERPATSDERLLLQDLGLPHLRWVVDLTKDWEPAVSQGLAEVVALNTGLELEVIADEDGNDLEVLFDHLRAHVKSVARILVFSSARATSQTLATRARKAAIASDLNVPLGGGTRAYFNELNRAALPLDLLDAVAYSITPQVHAFDDQSVLTTIAVQRLTVSNALRISAGLPVVVGPVTLLPRFNPYALSETPKDTPESDPRQTRLFNAAWTLGSIAALSYQGAASLTYHETYGPRGLVDLSLSDRVFPVYHLLAEVTRLRGYDLCSVGVSDSDRVAALALSRDSHLSLFVANMTSEQIQLGIGGGMEGQPALRLLDEDGTSHDNGGSGFRLAHDRSMRAAQLGPFNLVRVDWSATS